MGCSGVAYQGGADDESGISDAQFVKKIKQKIDYLVKWQDTMNDIESVRGSIVKWSGNIVEIRNDRIQIVGRMVFKSHFDSPLIQLDRNDPHNFNLFDNFLFLIDHPLPRETRIGEIIQTVKVWDDIFVAGKVTGLETIVTASGQNLTMPIVQGYILSKDNDAGFSNPVWVGNKM
ncbi:hypothetical protein ACFL0G_01255 [Candidatus Zixiibacteriota bacterium]